MRNNPLLFELSLRGFARKELMVLKVDVGIQEVVCFNLLFFFSLSILCVNFYEFLIFHLFVDVFVASVIVFVAVVLFIDVIF